MGDKPSEQGASPAPRDFLEVPCSDPLVAVAFGDPQCSDYTGTIGVQGPFPICGATSLMAPLSVLASASLPLVAHPHVTHGSATTNCGRPSASSLHEHIALSTQNLPPSQKSQGRRAQQLPQCQGDKFNSI